MDYFDSICSGGEEVFDDDDIDLNVTMFSTDKLAVDHITSTPLFDAIVSGDWGAVDFFLKSGTFSFSPFQSDEREGVSGVEDQVETWIVCKHDNGGHNWRQLPIHAAVCYGAPVETLKELIDVYPAGLCCAAMPDGNLPLHLAVKFNRTTDVLRLLMKSYPHAYNAKNFLGEAPVKCAKYIESPQGRTKFQLLEAFEECERHHAMKDRREVEEELSSVRKQVDEAKGALTKAQRELGYKKRFQIPYIKSTSERLKEWKISCKNSFSKMVESE